MALSKEEICERIAADFKRRRITHQIAADKIGTTKQTISNQISGKKRFSQNMAKKFAEAFGYSIPWLLYGEGQQFDDRRVTFEFDSERKMLYASDNLDPILNEGRKLRVADRLLQILNNKVAISAFRAYLAEDFDEYEMLRDKLERDYCYFPTIYMDNTKFVAALRRMRRFFTEVETKAAKELIVIEQRAAQGEIIDVDAELERFRRRIILIKDAYKDKAFAANPGLTEEEYLPETEKNAIREMMPEMPEGGKN